MESLETDFLCKSDRVEERVISRLPWLTNLAGKIAGSVDSSFNTGLVGKNQ